jgi:beta-lactamase class A
MKNLTVHEKAAYSLAAAMAALFLATAILAAALMGMLSKTEDEYSRYRTNTEIELSDLEKKKNELNAKLSDINNRIELAERSKTELENKIWQTETELSELKSSIGDSDGMYKKLNDQLAELKAELKAKETEITVLNNRIAEVTKSYGSDINKQYDILKQIYALLDNPAVKDANVSLYYEDLNRGYTLKVNEKVKYPSAGCLRTPFALSVLIAASNEMTDYEKKLAEYEALHGTSDGFPTYKFKYDLSRMFTYTEDKAVSGSGIIKDSEFGTEYTHKELFEAYLKYGDAVAEKELTKVYGTTLRKNFLANIGTATMKTDPSQATANDLALVIKQAYAFCESDAYYSDMMKDCMKKGVHNVMITPGIVGHDVIHGSGWDTGAYHDMAVVDGVHPYVIVFMSDMTNNDTVNKYINKLASLINELHSAFYQ